ncbi:MAG: helix-turn-helix domain-containing protein [Deltaproteobacteria bacterium]|nr:helix-turn-helix domain-containing protein [Deltaproteobacteria bacterium]
MQLYPLKEVARFFKIPPAELEALVKAQKIAFVEVGGELRFRCDHIVKFIRENTKQTQSEWLLEGA